MNVRYTTMLRRKKECIEKKNKKLVKVQTIRTGTVSKVTSGVLWESLTIAVKAVIAAIFERARAMRLAAR